MPVRICVEIVLKSSSEGVQFGTDMFGQQEGKGSVACGMMLLGLYLVFDSFTSQWQSRMFTKHRVRPDVRYVVLLILLQRIHLQHGSFGVASENIEYATWLTWDDVFGVTTR